MTEEYEIPDDYVEMIVQQAGGKVEFTEHRIKLTSPSGKYAFEFSRPATHNSINAAMSVLNRLALEAA